MLCKYFLKYFVLHYQYTTITFMSGGDPGLNNQKTPTTLLLTPDQQFHSFGFAARDFFHDLEPEDACKWFYFDKFKKHLHNRMARKILFI